MKTMKKAFAVLLVLAIAMSLSVAAFANIEFKIEVQNDSSKSNASIAGKTFTAYEVFKVTYSGMDSGTGIPSGASGTSGASGASYSYTIADALAGWQYDSNPASDAEAMVSDNALIEYVATLKNNHDELQRFARTALARLKQIEAEGTSSESYTPTEEQIELKGKIKKAENTAAISFETSAESVVITCPEAGYYIVSGTAKADKNNSLLTACSLSTTNPVASVQAKVSAPKPVKTVFDGTSDKDQLSAQMGQDLPFKIAAKVPNMVGYDGYLLGFNDTMTVGLTLAALDLNGEGQNFFVKISTSTTETPAVVEVTDVTSSVTYEAEDSENEIKTAFDNALNNSDNDCNLYYNRETGEMKLRFPDLKNYIETYNKTHTDDGLDIPVDAEITVEYHAVVNEKCMTTSLPDCNAATLDYTRDPATVTDYSTTPADEVRVYSFDLGVKKFSQASSGYQFLEGAEFQLFTVSKAGMSSITDKAIATNDADTVKRSYYKYTPDNTTGATDDKINEGSVSFVDSGDTMKTDKNGELTKSFRGLKTGTYYLVESKAPAGYEALKYPVRVEIEDYLNDHGVIQGGKFTLYTYDASSERYVKDTEFGTDGTDSTSWVSDGPELIPIENKPGSELPTTGGVGTTIFYTVGAVMMASALVLFITKKKMSV